VNGDEVVAAGGNAHAQQIDMVGTHAFLSIALVSQMPEKKGEVISNDTFFPYLGTLTDSPCVDSQCICIGADVERQQKDINWVREALHNFEK